MKPVVLTPEQIAAGVQKNASEYQARVAALRGLHDQRAYNPLVSEEVLIKAAVEAQRGAVGKPAMTLHGPGNEGDVRAAGRDAEAEAMAKANGGRRERKAKESASAEGEAGDGGVQARQAPVFQRVPDPFAQAGGGHSAVGGTPRVEVYQAESREDAEAQLKTFVGHDVISATIRVKYSVVVVRE